MSLSARRAASVPSLLLPHAHTAPSTAVAKVVTSSRGSAAPARSPSRTPRVAAPAEERWDRSRTPPPLRQIGIDEKYLGRRNKLADDYVTIVSNLETGEPLWIGYGRSEATVAKWLATQSPEQKAAITLAVMDLHAPFAAAIRNDPAMKHVVIAHDPFHVMKRATEAIDDLRRETFFRAGGELRRIGRGTRWLVMRAWEKCSESDRARLRELFSYNRLLARACGAVAELAVVVAAPAEGLTVGEGSALVADAHRDVDGAGDARDAGRSPPTLHRAVDVESAGLPRSGPTIADARAHPQRAVVAPTPDGAVPLQRAGPEACPRRSGRRR
jgi:hypothetical protein